MYTSLGLFEMAYPATRR